jgi:hypothetical protein
VIDRRVLSGLRNRWDAFLFAPASPVNLAAARIVFSAHALWILGSRDLAAISGVSDVFWAGVPVADRWRFLLFPGNEGIETALQVLTAISLLAAITGVWPRTACFVSGLLLYHLAPLETIFWTSNPFERGLTVSTMALIALGVSRCGDALTITGRSQNRAASPDYGWPLRLVQLQLCLVYFIAGYSKLYYSGLGWISPDNMRNWLTVFSQQDQILVVGRLGVWIADHPWMCAMIAVFALVLDLVLVLVVFIPRLRIWLISMTLAFHAGVLLTMGILFLNIPQLLVFVDWDRVAAAGGRRTRTAAIG